MPVSALADFVGAQGLAPLERRLVTAEVVYNGIGTPRQAGAVALQALGSGGELTVVEVGAAAELRGRAPGMKEVSAGFAISPPVVNAHTHLDLSGLKPMRLPYVEFIANVIAHASAGGRGLAAAKLGLTELKAHGTTVLGDIVTDPAVMELLLADVELEGVAYWEVIGPEAQDAERKFEEVRARVNAFRQLQRPGGVRVGLSPHAPHTVSAPLLTRLAAWAKAEGLPLAIHVAESEAEVSLHRRGDGPLAAALAKWRSPFEASGLSPVAYLDRIGFLACAPTLVHMVQVDEDDVRLVQRHGCVVVHCPRSNDALACGRFPWELYARHGVDVALGTDSSGSSPDLDVTAEVGFALTLHGAAASPQALVRGAVKGGYRALGLPTPRVVKGAHASGLVTWLSRQGLPQT